MDLQFQNNTNVTRCHPHIIIIQYLTFCVVSLVATQMLQRNCLSVLCKQTTAVLTRITRVIDEAVFTDKCVLENAIKTVSLSFILPVTQAGQAHCSVFTHDDRLAWERRTTQCRPLAFFLYHAMICPKYISKDESLLYDLLPACSDRPLYL
jgi:hypothetical protein